MCTLTWRNEDGLEVFFNRDELKTRSRAEPPRAFVTERGTHYLSPIDPDAGGTWMLANEFGIIICLLNRWHEESGLTFTKSRGQIVSALADARTITDVASKLPSLCAASKPFDLAIFSDTAVSGFSWSGKKISTFDPKMPLTSSSFQFETVRKAREEAFDKRSNLEQFQCNQGTESSAYTVRMNRPDAQTWSRSHLQISDKEISWDYWEEFPDLVREPALHRSDLPIKR